ncbi:MAG: carbon-nitrogen hydrolase family protein [Gammaproteobacteria bacterium]|nr:carbon-nitrogen hydrolase family protein [Gammaproteobacteria bacterium]MDD9895507.1 carbon-nitrogen hydrolase family protein [Gammaproteobacteria bacterium]MDD9959856.1 carbon-nitrogen hydrolase family protein [Gammaproteobacteria bacterium]
MTEVVAAIQMVSTGDVDANLAAAAQLITEAAGANAKLVSLPEVFAVLEGGPMQRFGEIEGSGKIQDFLSSQAKQHGLILVGGTIPLLSRPNTSPADANHMITDGRVRPACLVYGSDGKQIARYDKMHLFDVKVADQQANYSESRSYEPGDEIVSLPTETGHLGLTVCYDLRFPELYRELFKRGAEIVTVPSAFTVVTGKAHWETLIRARAIENQCYIVAAAQGGKHNEKRETWGHTMIVDPWGTVLDSIESGAGVAVATIDLEKLREIREKMPIADQFRL